MLWGGYSMQISVGGGSGGGGDCENEARLGPRAEPRRRGGIVPHYQPEKGPEQHGDGEWQPSPVTRPR